MFVSFSVGNYLSFKETVKFSLEASSIREFRDKNVFDTPLNNLSLIRSAAIYGPNAGGKSNLLKSIAFVARLIKDSAKGFQSNEIWPDNRFKLSTSTVGKPSFFEIEFIHDNEGKYRYSFSLDDKGIVNENLFYQTKNKENNIFNRDGAKILVEEKFNVNSQVIESTRPNALFLSTASMFNISWASDIISTISKLRYIHLRIPSSMAFAEATGDLLEDSRYGAQVKQLIAASNLGFKEVVTDTLSIKPESTDSSKESLQRFLFSDSKLKLIFTIHNQLDEKGTITKQIPFSFDEESDGTKKYFSLIGPIVEALGEGKVLFIDEFTSHLHPLLAEQLIKLFHNPQINIGNGQLILATQNTYLLNEDLYRKDQIFFIQKDEFSASKITNFSQLKDIRQDSNFEKRYIHDRQLGFVPNWSLNLETFWNTSQS